jgi:hypothetical protein
VLKENRTGNVRTVCFFYSCAEQVSEDMAVDAGFLSDNDAVLVEEIKDTA